MNLFADNRFEFFLIAHDLLQHIVPIRHLRQINMRGGVPAYGKTFLGQPPNILFSQASGCLAIGFQPRSDKYLPVHLRETQ